MERLIGVPVFLAVAALTLAACGGSGGDNGAANSDDRDCVVAKEIEALVQPGTSAGNESVALIADVREATEELADEPEDVRQAVSAEFAERATNLATDYRDLAQQAQVSLDSLGGESAEADVVAAFTSAETFHVAQAEAWEFFAQPLLEDPMRVPTKAEIEEEQVRQSELPELSEAFLSSMVAALEARGFEQVDTASFVIDC